MEEIIALLTSFISGAITADQFVDQYLNLAREIRDEQYALEEAQPGLHQKRVRLQEQFLDGLISPEEFQRRWEQWAKQIQGARVRPGSREDKIIAHLMVEADAYYPDPESPYEIGEEQLTASVREALDELTKLYPRRN